MEERAYWRRQYFILTCSYTFSLFGVSGHCQMRNWAKWLTGQMWGAVLLSFNFYLGNAAKVKAKAMSSCWYHETWNGHWHGGNWTFDCLSGSSLSSQGNPSPYPQPHPLDSKGRFDSCDMVITTNLVYCPALSVAIKHRYPRTTPVLWLHALLSLFSISWPPFSLLFYFSFSALFSSQINIQP